MGWRRSKGNEKGNEKGITKSKGTNDKGIRRNDQIPNTKSGYAAGISLDRF
jgi:hypothetical protein